MPRLIREVVSSTASVFAAGFGWRACHTAAEFAIAGSFFSQALTKHVAEQFCVKLLQLQ